MAKQFATFAADKLRWSHALPNASVYTVMFWAKFNSVGAVFKPLFYRTNNASHPFTFYGATNANPTLTLTLDYDMGDLGGSGTNGSNVTLGQWYHHTVIANGTSATSYINSILDITDSITGSLAAITNDQLCFGCDDDTDAETGLCSICCIKFWDVPLNIEQIRDEIWSAGAKLRDNLVIEAPLQSGVDPYDTRGQQWDTFAGNITDPDEPPGVDFWSQPSSRVIRRLSSGAAAAASGLLLRRRRMLLGGGV